MARTTPFGPLSQYLGRVLIGREERFQVEVSDGDIDGGRERRERGDQGQLTVITSQLERDGEAEMAVPERCRRHVHLELGEQRVGRDRRDRQPFVGEARGFSVNGDCWTWSLGSDPVRCETPSTPTTVPPATEPPPTSPPPSSRPATSPPATSPPTTQPPATSPPTTSPPTTSPPTTSPPTTSPPAATTTPPVERIGTVNGCNTYGQNCEGNPIDGDVPPAGYNYQTWPKVTSVPNGAQLSARCWARGGTTWNYAASHNPPDYGPNPYESDIYFYVRAPNGEWGWIPDTYFVRDKVNMMGLPAC